MCQNQENNTDNIEKKQSESIPDSLESDEPHASENLSDTNESGEMRVAEPSASFKFLASLSDFFEILVMSIITVLIIFTFGFRLCRVDGNSMNKTLNHNEKIITTNLFYTPRQGDIVVFHISNEYFHEPIIKRVIATEGQLVRINFTSGEIFVDGIKYDDSHAYFDVGRYDVRPDMMEEYVKTINGDICFEGRVPEGKLFAMGDNRNNSTDSRSYMIGFIDTDTILGKAIFRLDPFTDLTK